MEKKHLIPELIVDLVRKAEVPGMQNSTGPYVARLEAIRDYINESLNRIENRKRKLSK